MSQGTLHPKMRYLGKSVLDSSRTDGQTDTKVNTEDTLSGVQEIFLQSIINNRSNIIRFDQKLLIHDINHVYYCIADLL